MLLWVLHNYRLSTFLFCTFGICNDYPLPPKNNLDSWLKFSEESVYTAIAKERYISTYLFLPLAFTQWWASMIKTNSRSTDTHWIVPYICTHIRALLGSPSWLRTTKGSGNLNLSPVQQQLSQMFLFKSDWTSLALCLSVFSFSTITTQKNISSLMKTWQNGVRSVWYNLRLAQPMAALTRHVKDHWNNSLFQVTWLNCSTPS